MIGIIRTFFALPGTDRWLVIKITLIVPLIQVGLKTIKFKRTLALLRPLLNRKPRRPERELNLIEKHTYYLYLYRRKLPSLGKCLARSLTLWFLLQRAGIETELKFGVKKENDKLLAHAWIEYQGRRLEERSEVDKGYVPFSASILSEVVKSAD